MVENILKPTDGCVSKKKRLGCGPGSKLGSTCGRGHDGQRSRSGKNKPYLGFEGGQMPFYRRIPKVGFNRRRKKLYLISLNQLSKFEEGETISLSILQERKIVSRQFQGLVILAQGELNKKINVEADRVSKAARIMIEKMGGNVCLPSDV